MSKVKLKQASKDKRNLSRFFITINSNQAEDEKFQSRATRFLSHIDKFLKVRDGYTNDDTMEIEVDYDFEKGEKVKRLHCHATVTIRHNTNILFDYQKIQTYARKYHYYIKSTYVKPTEEEEQRRKLKNYVTKTKRKKPSGDSS